MYKTPFPSCFCLGKRNEEGKEISNVKIPTLADSEWSFSQRR